MLLQQIQINNDMHFGPEEQKLYDEAKICHICKKGFKEGEKTAKDHDHFSGKFRGKTHMKCNVNFKNKYSIPIISHNGQKYDSHLIINHIFNAVSGQVKVVAQTIESYIAIYKHIENSRIRYAFIDSFKFLNTSLDSLVSLLDKEKDFGLLNNFYDKNLDLLMKKSFYPYEFMDDIKKLDETSLPEKKHFYSSLTDSHITDENYTHALKVWDVFLEKKTMKDYMLFYNKLDVLLLSIVFEKFRDTCMREYELDPAHYISLPSLSFDAMLKCTQVQIELISNIDMFLWVEKSIRGGMCEVIQKYASSNNPYIPETYDSSKPESYITCFDVNSLYSTSMSEKLPIGDYEFIKNIDLDTSPDGDYGYLLEVDVSYPQNLHNFFKDMPLFCDHLTPPGGKFKKLMRTLNDKKNYIIHLKPLQQAIKLGVVVDKIHKILKFKQSNWMKPYIIKNNELRASTSNQFERNLWKLMNNSVFGKTIENLRKRNNIYVCNEWKGRVGCEALIARPTFKRLKIFNENLVGVEMQQTRILMNKPILIGSCILDISKFIFNSFYYDFLLKHYNQNDCKVLYIDTDSYYLELKNKNIYHVMAENLEAFDTSNFPENNIFSIPIVNKQKLGLMKAEYGSQIICEYVGLSPKQYAMRFKGKIEKKKCKGVKKIVVEKQIKFGNYMDCLKNCTIVKKTQNCIRSKNHKLYTLKEEKIALSSNDDKRFQIKDSYDTLPYGHKDIVTCEKMSFPPSGSF